MRSQELGHLPVPPDDSPALLKQPVEVRRGLHDDDRVAAEPHGNPLEGTEDAKVGSIVHKVPGNRIGETAAHGHELIAAVVAQATIGERLQCPVVEAPPHRLDHIDDRTRRCIGSGKAARELNPIISFELLDQTPEGSREESSVSVYED